MQGMLQLSDTYRKLRDAKKDLEAALKDTNAQIAEVEEQLVAQMVDSEVQNFSRDGMQFYLSTQTYASPVAQRRDDLHTWLKMNGFEGLVKETVHAQTLSAFIREQLEEAEVLPAGLAELVNVYEKTGVSLRKA